MLLFSSSILESAPEAAVADGSGPIAPVAESRPGVDATVATAEEVGCGTTGGGQVPPYVSSEYPTVVLLNHEASGLKIE